jgi:hypothetical protein
MTKRLGSNYVDGVPTPYSMHVHPYPTRFHGGIWSRPTFGFPVAPTPSTVFLPPRDIDMIPDRPPNGYSGLGELQYDVGEGIFRPGGYGGGVFDGNLAGAPALGSAGSRSLGDDASDATNYPWLQVSSATSTLQQATNTALVAAGYCPIAVDGKLGPATCGARNALTATDTTGAIWSNPSTCQSFTSPPMASSGCGSGGSTAVVKAGSATPSTSLPGLSSNTKKILEIAGAGLLAVGVVYFIKKRRGKR